MSRLLDALRADPSASFQLECSLPSGNVMRGVVGPMMGAKVAANLYFDNDPSEDDLSLAREIIDYQMGTAPEIAMVTNTTEERHVAEAAMRRFFGGGQG